MAQPQPHPEVEVAAIVGNGRLLAGFDSAGVLRTLTAPHLDYPQHIHSSSVRLGAPGSNGQLRRLNGLGWRHLQDYVPGTNVLRTRSSARNGVKIEQRAAAVGDALLIGIQLRDGGPLDAVSLVWEIHLQLGGQRLANALLYLPDHDAVVASHREHALALGSTPPLEHVLSKDRGLGGVNRSRRGGAPLTAVGQVSAEVRMTVRRRELALLVIALGSPSEALSKMTHLRRHLTGSRTWPFELGRWAGKDRTRARQRLSIPGLGATQAEAADCYERSLLTVQQLVDRSGAILAGPPIDEGYLRSGGYAFCWPRDAAFIAHGLGDVGVQAPARAFFSWALSVQPQDGIWRQRYYADGTVGPCWAAHQLDETGTLLWALDQHLRYAYDRELLAGGLKAAVRAYRGIADLATETGWPPITQNLWEDQTATHLYTLAALLSGARAWKQRARTARKPGAVALLAHVESQLQNVLDGWPVEPKTGIMARALVTNAQGQEPDFTPDASLLGLSVPFAILDPEDERLRATIRGLERALVSSTGRVRRYVGDTYRGSNAWPLFGLWLAWHYVRIGNRSGALRLYRRVLHDRTPAGLIAEQVNTRTGQAVWVVPLPWAHAWFLVVSHQLSKLTAVQPDSPRGHADDVGNLPPPRRHPSR